MKKVYVFVAEGFEEMELIIPVDLWRRSGLEVELIGMAGQLVRGSHDVELVCDATFEERLTKWRSPDAIFLPGGPGSYRLAESAALLDLLRKEEQNGCLIAAICAAPAIVLHKAGLLNEQQFTCYPGLQQQVDSGIYVDQMTVRSGRLLTGKGAGASASLAAEVIAILQGNEKAVEVMSATLFQSPSVTIC